MNGRGLTWAAFLLSLSVAACNSSPSPVTLAITNVWVIDGTGAPARPKQTVLIGGQRIVAVGSSAAIEVPE